MSHYHGTISRPARKTPVTARGHKGSGITMHAASWAGAVRVDLDHEASTGRDRYSVTLEGWPGKNIRRVLAEGYLDEAGADIVA